MKTTQSKKVQEKSDRLWQKTRYANLVRNTSSESYFARLRLDGKLIWRSLGTDALTVAAQRLPDTIKQLKDEQILRASGTDPRMTFEGAAKVYLERIQASPDFKPKTKAYHAQRLDALVKSWPALKLKALKDVTKSECVEWRNAFAHKYSPTSFNHTLGILRAIFEIGVEAGARRDNPAKAKEMKRLRESPKRLQLPEHTQFEKFVDAIATSGSGHSRPCAELVQFLAFGGFRIGEAKHITWADCDFKRGIISVAGAPDSGLKGRSAGEIREVPMIPDMRRLLEQMRKETPGEMLVDRVMRVAECQRAMDRAAKEVGMARLTHHDLRHLFATRCIESGVDVPTVSRWLGHKDGGALAMKTYGHLRDQHSNEMAQKVVFVEAVEAKGRNPTSASSVDGRSAIAEADDCARKKAIAQAKSKYLYPWWASNEPLEVFVGQLSEPVTVVPKERFRDCARSAMGREVFLNELTDRESLADELAERVSREVLDKINVRIHEGLRAAPSKPN